MSNMRRLLGVSLVALILCSVATTGSSASTYSYSLSVGKGSYAKYLCVFSNDTMGYTMFSNGSTFSYIVADVNITFGYAISYANDTHVIEGAFFLIYVNDTFADLVDTGDLYMPLRLLLSPTSDAWWNLLKSWAENLSVYNKVTIGSDKVDVTWFTTNGANETFTGSIDRDTGVVLNFKNVYLDLGTNKTYIFEVVLVETNIPNVPVGGAEQPTSLLLVGGIAGVFAALGLCLGFFIGKRRV